MPRKNVKQRQASPKTAPPRREAEHSASPAQAALISAALRRAAARVEQSVPSAQREKLDAGTYNVALAVMISGDVVVAEPVSIQPAANVSAEEILAVLRDVESEKRWSLMIARSVTAVVSRRRSASQRDGLKLAVKAVRDSIASVCRRECKGRPSTHGAMRPGHVRAGATVGAPAVIVNDGSHATTSPVLIELKELPPELPAQRVA